MERKKIHFRENWLLFLGILGEAELILRILGANEKYFQGAEKFSFRDLGRSMHYFQGSREHSPPGSLKKVLYFKNTLKQELSTTKTYEHNRLDETSIVNRHRCHMAAKFGVFVDKDHTKLPTLYWLPKLHKRPYKSHFIANSSSCTTTEMSVLLTSCLNAIKTHVYKYCTTVYERNGKKSFWSIKNSGEILNK